MTKHFLAYFKAAAETTFSDRQSLLRGVNDPSEDIFVDSNVD
jgi:hypothetical protein